MLLLLPFKGIKALFFLCDSKNYACIQLINYSHDPIQYPTKYSEIKVLKPFKQFKIVKR